LDFSSAGSRDYVSLAPELKQVFFMGDGLTSAFDLQNIVVPDGATRLFLGTMDGYEWVNNIGSFEVTLAATSVPEGGATLVLLLASAGSLLAVARRNRK
jgi:hypothetical protein